MSTPTFLIATVTTEEVPSRSVPKSTLGGRRWNPLTTALGPPRETVRSFVLSGSSREGNWSWAVLVLVGCTDLFHIFSIKVPQEPTDTQTV